MKGLAIDVTRASCGAGDDLADLHGGGLSDACLAALRIARPRLLVHSLTA
jgi:hypothetical protein